MSMRDRIRPSRPRNPAAMANARGYILLPVVMGITLIATIAFLLNMESGNDVSQAGAELQTSQVSYIAEAAFTHALWHVENNTCSGDLSFDNTLEGYGHYSAVLETAASRVNRYSFATTADSYIDEDNKSQGHGSETEIRIRNQSGRELQGLFFFNLSAIPENEQVVEATAWFYLTHSEPGTVLSVHAVEESWTEANASWNRIDEDFDDEPFAVIAPRATTGAWISVNLTALTEEWIEDADDNYGLLILAPDEARESRFAAREAGVNLRARLDVVTADRPVSPVQITTVATLTGVSSAAGDISRSRIRPDIQAYQTPVEYVLQPGPDAGKDTRIDDWRPTRNDGNGRWIEVSAGVGSTSHSLLQFALDIPEDASIDSAILSLFQHSGSSGGVANVHRLNQSWAEGSGPSSSGATWLRRDGSRAWDSRGGDMHPDLVASANVSAGEAQISLDISALVQGWIDGSYLNYGLALVPGSSSTRLRFESSDTPEAARMPVLSVVYRCECGSPCRPD